MTASITALRSEAAAAGDTRQVAICDSALAGDTAALAEGQRVILAFLTQRDDLAEPLRLLSRGQIGIGRFAELVGVDRDTAAALARSCGVEPTTLDLDARIAAELAAR